MRIAVLASGQGSNLEAILDAEKRGRIAGQVVLVISDCKTAPALERARQREIRALFIDPEEFRTRVDYDRAVIAELKKDKISLVVLAGFMRLLTSEFIDAYPMKIMNIHPSILPAFPGLDGVEQALNYGVKVSGCTVHFVDYGLDSGPIILQETVPVIEQDTIETLHQRIHAVEHRIYSTAVDLFCRDKLKIEGRRCTIIE